MRPSVVALPGEGGGNMPRTLRSGRSLEDLKKEARNLLHDLRQQDSTAVKRYCLLDPDADTFRARLADAQYVIARECGCKSWRELKQRLVTTGISRIITK